MPVTSKQSKKKLIVNALESARFRWEFLRRSEKYRIAHQRFQRRYDDWLQSDLEPAWLGREALRLGEDPRVPKPGSFINKASEDLKKFRHDWGIDPTDPSAVHSPFVNQLTTWIIDYGPATSHWASQPGVIVVCVDVLGPVHEVLGQLTLRIKSERRRLLTGSNQPTKHTTQRVRHRFELYPDYLKAFDLHTLGKTNKEIATLVFRRTTVSDPEKRISEYRNRARLIIKNVENGIW